MISRARIDGSSIYDNWGKLVDAVIKREDYLELCRSQSSDSIDFTPDSSFRSDDDLNPAELEVEEISTLITERLWKEQHEPAVDSANVAATNETAVARRKSRFSIFGRKKEVTNRRKEPRILEENRRPEPKIAEERASLIDPAIVDDIIRRLLEVRGSGVVQLSEAEIRQLCAASREIFLAQPNLLELDRSHKICGVFQHQDTDLLRLFEEGGFPPDSNYLFLGDYVDRGKQSLETICLLLAYKIKYPENFFLVRGNPYQIKYPENSFLFERNRKRASINRIYGFDGECKVFNDCFNCLPVAALIDDRILCLHGGVSLDLSLLDHIRNSSRPIDPYRWTRRIQVTSLFTNRTNRTFLQIHGLDNVCSGYEEDIYDFSLRGNGIDPNLVFSADWPPKEADFQRMAYYLQIEGICPRPGGVVAEFSI